MRQYIGNALAKAARDIDGAVLVNAHPSRTGLSSGNLDGGSTGWNNSVRSRWSLARPDAQEGETVDPDERILTRRKANYSSVGDQIKLRWKDGLLIPLDSGITGGVFTAASKRNEIEGTFLVLLARAVEDGRPISPSKNASNYAAELFSKMPDRRGFTKREFGYAMEGLLEQKRIRIEVYGPPSKPKQKLVTVTSEPNEADK